jgi:hypothetical protein
MLTPAQLPPETVTDDRAWPGQRRSNKTRRPATVPHVMALAVAVIAPATLPPPGRIM